MTKADTSHTSYDPTRGAIVFGRAVIERSIRRDRLASVFAARASEGDGWFTLWSAHADQLTCSEAADARFVVAMEHLHSIQHPSLARVVAWQTTPTGPQILATMLRGRSLRDVIASEPFVPIDDVTRVVRALGEALEVLHNVDVPVTHLALTPERVIIGDDGAVSIEEAGYLQSLIDAGMVSAQQTAVFAQPGYMLPPELLHAPGPEADVFLLAQLAFEALTGQLPFGAATQSDLIVALRGEYLPSAAALRPGLAPEIDEVFERAWRVGRGGLYVPVRAFADDFVRVIHEDSGRRPTFPGGNSDVVRRAARASEAAVTRSLPPSNGATTSREPVTTDNVDRAFDDMLSLDVGGSSDAADHSSDVPAVIDFTQPIPPMSAIGGPVEVPPTKPTLVGATATQSSEPDRPPISDTPTPSMGYERLKLLTDESSGYTPRSAIDLTAEAEAISEPPAPAKQSVAPPSPVDATTKIEKELLDSLRASGEEAPGTVPRPRPFARGVAPRAGVAAQTRTPHQGSGGTVPPPPSLATRPSAPPSSRPPSERATGSHSDHGSLRAPSGKHNVDAAAIPPPPKVPSDAAAFVGTAFRGATPLQMPRTVPSSPPELTLSDPVHVGEIPLTEIEPTDLIDTDFQTPGDFSNPAARSSQGPLRAPPAGSTRPAPAMPANHEIGKAWAEQTHPSGTPLPPARPVAPMRDETAPIGLVPRISVTEIEELIEDPPTQQIPREKPSQAPSVHPPVKQPLRAATPSVVVRETLPPNASSPRPATERIASESRPIALTEPPPPPQVDPVWLHAARFLGASTVIAAVAVSIGFWYLRAPLFELRDELARLRIEQAEARAQLRAQPEEPDAAVATVPDAAVAMLPLDVPPVGVPPVTTSDVVVQVPVDVVVAPIDVRTAASVVHANGPRVSAPVGTVPGDAVRARLSGAMRSGINDCVEGVDDPRFVTVGVRYDGVTGSVTRVRLHGIFQEPPMGPCIEQVVRRVRAEPFTAPFWDVDFRFPVPQPRWRPPM